MIEQKRVLRESFAVCGKMMVCGDTCATWWLSMLKTVYRRILRSQLITNSRLTREKLVKINNEIDLYHVGSSVNRIVWLDAIAQKTTINNEILGTPVVVVQEIWWAYYTYKSLERLRIIYLPFGVALIACESGIYLFIYNVDEIDALMVGKWSGVFCGYVGKMYACIRKYTT